MNLLPKCHQEFSLADYWEQFFKKRGGKAFEWYGEYGDLCGILHKYIKPADKLLVAGCGSSSLSADLYDVGYKSITNIDISDLVIKQMKEKNSSREGMKWQKMDIYQMEFTDGEFSALLDKGTLDAIMTDDSAAVVENVEKMFGEIQRVLRIGGRYICVSLAQDHIIKKVLQHFSNEGWPIRICRVYQDSDDDHQFHMPVFVFVLTKFKKMPNMKPILEFSAFDEKVERKESLEQLLKSVQDLQNYGIIRDQLTKKNFQNEEQVALDLYGEDSPEARFSMHIVDRQTKSAGQKFAVFIVPQGRETDWLFSSSEGRKELADQAGFQRLVVTTLNRCHSFDNLDSVKAELSSKVMELAPPGVGKQQVPFLSIGEEICLRQVREQVKSSLSGDITVEDVSVNGTMYRRLVFLKTKHILQSEVRLVQEYKKTKSGKKKGKGTLKLDSGHLATSYHPVMVAGLSMLKDFSKRIDNDVKILLIGLGGGNLPNFLYKHFPQIKLDVVELDPVIVKVAENWFGFQHDANCQVHVEDGLEYILTAVKQGSQYDVVMFDVDSKDTSQGMSCPPQPFVEKSLLENVKSLLKPEGLFILNLVCRNTAIRKSVLDNLSVMFKHICCKKLTQDVNEVVLAMNSESASSCSSLVSKQDLESLQSLINKHSKTAEHTYMDITQCLEGLKLVNEFT